MTMFYVSTNMQGDVLSIHLSDGTKIAQYDYDAWGKATIATVSKDSSGNYVYTTVTESTAPNHIATLNPIRYRGYYYDSDLGLYYLQSRYYDANIGRFINADDRIVVDFNSNNTSVICNVFAYCCNNPLNNIDPSGHHPGVVFASFLNIIAKAVIAAVVAVVAVAVVYTVTSYATRTISKSISNTKSAVEADKAIKEKVKKDSKDRYWTASKSEIVSVGVPISYEKAVSEVAAGRDVFALTKADAKAVAFAAGGNVDPMYHPKHKLKVNYYEHYHVANHSNEAHVWYLY